MLLIVVVSSKSFIQFTVILFSPDISPKDSKNSVIIAVTIAVVIMIIMILLVIVVIIILKHWRNRVTSRYAL